MKAIIKTIKSLVAEHGLEILEQNQRLMAMLADLHPNEKRFRYLIGLSLRAEIPKKLINMQTDKLSDFESHFSVMKYYFKEEYFLEDKATNSVFDFWGELFNFKVGERQSITKLDTFIPIVEKVEKAISDIDGNIYHSVKIGNQVWLVENLKSTRFNNGDLIRTTYPATKEILSEKEPKYQWAYDGDERNVAKYGRLYTWYAASDLRGLAPEGWRIPSATDWELFESSRQNWVGFASQVQMAGRRDKNKFDNLGNSADLWCSTRCFIGNSLYACSHLFDWDIDRNRKKYHGRQVTVEYHGYSIRCMRDY